MQLHVFIFSNKLENPIEQVLATTFQSIYMAVAINLLDFHGLTNEACS